MIAKPPELLSEEELWFANEIARSAMAGVYTLREIYGSHWDSIESPTKYGSQFKASAELGLIKRITYDGKGSDNSARYMVADK